MSVPAAALVSTPLPARALPRPVLPCNTATSQQVVRASTAAATVLTLHADYRSDSGGRITPNQLDVPVQLRPPPPRDRPDDGADALERVRAPLSVAVPPSRDICRSKQL
jgi:hypothetical protein